MSYLVAYYDIDQNEINDFIKKNEIDIEDWESSQKIAKFYKEKYIKDAKHLCKFYDPSYKWNEICEIHEIYSRFNINFDERFTNRRYQAILEEKTGRTYPLCLENIWIRNSEDAIEVAHELRIFFADDVRLIKFADWLDETSKFCSTYEYEY